VNQLDHEVRRLVLLAEERIVEPGMSVAPLCDEDREYALTPPADGILEVHRASPSNLLGRIRARRRPLPLILTAGPGRRKPGRRPVRRSEEGHPYALQYVQREEWPPISDEARRPASPGFRRTCEVLHRHAGPADRRRLAGYPTDRYPS